MKGLRATLRRRAFCGLVAALFLVHAGLLTWLAWADSPTGCEPAHLAAGLCAWDTGTFDLYHVNTPLVRLVAAAPLLALRPEVNWSGHTGGRIEFAKGSELLSDNRPIWRRMMFLARLASVPFSLVGMAVAGWWAAQLYGRQAGLAALVLWCFSPYTLAHGHLVSPDFGGAVFALLASAAFWCWYRQPGWERALWWGLVLGLALLSKHTVALLVPLSAALALVPQAGGGTRTVLSLAKRLGQALVGLAVAVGVLNLGYGFQGTGKRLGDYRFISPRLAGIDVQAMAVGRGGNRFEGTWLGRLPVPLPGPYVQGADTQWGDLHGGRISYLHGIFREKGWWYFYIYGFMVKTPLGVLVLVPIALVLRRLPGMGAGWRDELMLLAPSLALLAFVSAHHHCTQNLRYALPVLPGLLVWVSSTARAAAAGGPWAALVIWGLIGWAVASSILWLPHSLAYFNELTGIPADGGRHLLDSNIDWGQDLFRLKAWVDAHPERRPLYVANYGFVHPDLAGIEAEELWHAMGISQQIKPGWYVISVNFLHGYAIGGAQRVRDDRLAFFRERVPTERIGQTLYVYHIPPR